MSLRRKCREDSIIPERMIEKKRGNIFEELANACGEEHKPTDAPLARHRLFMRPRGGGEGALSIHEKRGEAACFLLHGHRTISGLAFTLCE